MPFQIKKGATSVTRYIMVVDSGDGTPETAATITSFDLQYTRFGIAPVAKVDATALAATDSAWDDNKMFEIDGTSSPGLYRVDWPDLAFATGADGVVLVVTQTEFHPSVEIIHLVDFDPQSATDLGLSDVSDILDDTAEIGTAGAGLSDLGGMSTGMKGEVNAECDTTLADYDAPTKAEMDTAHGLLATPAQVATELGTYDGPTKAEMDTAHGLLATPAQVATELGTYDGPTKAEMDTAHALLATPANVATELGTYDGPTKAEMDTAHGLLATPAQVATEISDALATDTYAELSGVPAATSTIADKINWMFTLLRNKITTTATTQIVKKDDTTTTLGTSTVSDDGTTHSRGEFS